MNSSVRLLELRVVAKTAVQTQSRSFVSGHGPEAGVSRSRPSSQAGPILAAHRPHFTARDNAEDDSAPVSRDGTLRTYHSFIPNILRYPTSCFSDDSREEAPAPFGNTSPPFRPPNTSIASPLVLATRPSVKPIQQSLSFFHAHVHGDHGRDSLPTRGCIQPIRSGICP